jgi:hypothetical protein
MSAEALFWESLVKQNGFGARSASRRTLLAKTLALVLVMSPVLLESKCAHAGPPYRTDDPEPVDYRHWEFYAFATGAHIGGDTSGFGPAFEFNYGVIPNGQISVTAPLAFDAPTGAKPQFGYGDTELGFKYRFVDEDRNGALPQIAVYPLLEFPTGSQPRGLGQGYAQVFLPVWLQKSFGDWTTSGGGGYWFNQSARFGDRNYWYVSWLLQRKIAENLALGGEFFYQSAGAVQLPTNLPSPDILGFNLGGVYDVDEHNHLLASAGRGLLHATRTNILSWYFGWQVTY